MKKIIFEEIDRINELMGTESKLIAEQAGFLSNIGDELWQFISKAQKGFTKDQVDDVISKGRRNGVDSLSEKELQILVKHLDLAKLAKKYYDDGLIVKKGSIDATISNQITNIEQEGPESYLKIITGIQDAARKDFFGLIPGMKDELFPFADAFAEKLINDLNSILKTSKPELWNNITKVIRNGQTISSSTKEIFRKFIDGLSPKNIQTILRVLVRSLDNQKKLRDEFLQVSEQMANAIAAGKMTNYYEKKLSDILISSKKSYNDSIENVYRNFKKDPSFPGGQMVRDFETSGNYSELLKVINENSSWAKILKEDINSWIQLFNFKKLFTADFWNGWWNVVLKGSPVTFEQISQKLQRKGLKPYFISQVFGAYLVKFVVFPALYTFVKTITQIVGEFSQWVASFFGMETPWDPKQSGQLWSDLIKENFMGAIPNDLRLILPWNSLIDNIVIAAINNNPKSAEDYINKTIRKDVLDGAKKVKEDKLDEIQEVLIEDDLKSIIPQEFHKFLGRKADGTYELRNNKKKISYTIYKEDGVWGVEGKNSETNEIGLYPLENPGVLESLINEMK